MIRVALPAHLRNLARLEGEAAVEVAGAVTITSLLEALESAYPALRGTIRQHGTLKRRPFVRFFACGKDLSFYPPDQPLPEAIADGSEVFRVVGAIAGG